MFLVFINHSEVYTGLRCEFFDNIYRPIFVNAFFFVSGYLLFRKQWTESLLSLDKSTWLRCNGGGYYILRNLLFKLVIPTVLFSFLFFFPKKLLRGETIAITDFLCDTIGGGSIWFTPALTVAQLILFVFLSIRIKKSFYYLAFCFGLWIVSEALRFIGVQMFMSDTLPWYYKSGMEATVFMVLGGMYWKYEGVIMRIKRKWFICILSLLFYFAICTFLPEYIRTALDWQGLNALGFIASLVGSILLVFMAKVLPARIVTEFVGRNSIGFYFFCGSVVNVFALVGTRFVGIDSYWLVIIVAIVSFLASYVLVYFLNKYLPFVYDLRKLKSNK